MLTEEQIKNLKTGDKVLAEASVENVFTNGDIQVRVKSRMITNKIGEALATLRSSCLSLPPAKPKYDPCRKFKRGDKVRLHHVHGRPATHSGDMRALPCKNDKNEDVIYEVVLDEEEAEEGNGIWLISEYLNQYVIVHVSHIELVTPVEELEPYRVETGGYNKFRIKKGNLEYSYFPFGEHCVLNMDEAKAAAEAECDRLNAEHRKENN